MSVLSGFNIHKNKVEFPAFSRVNTCKPLDVHLISTASGEPIVYERLVGAMGPHRG
jgi:hypothetical protein